MKKHGLRNRLSANRRAATIKKLTKSAESHRRKEEKEHAKWKAIHERAAKLIEVERERLARLAKP